ncbi:MAG TPA: hypothetical protein VHX63_11220 [Acidobacteriaceae bacterium]|nr:hypothetical protein [Acidobacteriaceae bacterium]
MRAVKNPLLEIMAHPDRFQELLKRSKVHAVQKTCSVWEIFPAYFMIFVSFVAFFPDSLHGQTKSIQVPSSTVLSVQLLKHVPMKIGELLEGRLLYAVYVDNRIAIRAGTVLRGNVIQLNSDKSRRIHSRFRGDFTPFHIPVVRFDQLFLPDGIVEPIVSSNATNGAPILQLSPLVSKAKGSFVKRQIAQEKQRLKDSAAQITAPGRGDRLVQFLYTQLPYHPERIEAGTSWMVELTQPVNLLSNSPASHPGTPRSSKQVATEQKNSDGTPSAKVPGDQKTTWQLRAYLKQTISSANEKPGNTFQAVVTEPVFNADHALAVPEGSVLIGVITQAKPARSFGRQGRLRFNFQELKFPSGFLQPVEGTLTGADSNKSENLQLDSEGGMQPQSQNRVIVPLVLTLLASRAFDDDGSQVAHSAVASNGFGIVGRVVGIVASSRNVAAGIGAYAAVLAFYDLWIARGRNVVFVKNTRIEVTTTSTRSPLSASKAGDKPSTSK